MKRCLAFLALLLLGVPCEAKKGIEPPCSSGNFAVPPSQQPGPLIGFGENIIEQNQVQVYLFGDDLIGHKKHFVDLVPSVLYGITDRSSLFFTLPIAASYMAGGQHSSGLEDLFLQFEYALYARTSSCSSDQVTVVANVSFPTGSSSKKPATGVGSFAYFIGATYNRTWANWFVFTAYGAELPMPHGESPFSPQFLYQFGIGRNIANAWGWVFAWMTEIDGTFYTRHRIHGTVEPGTGGNIIYLTPSIWASSEDWILQFGLGYPVQQNLSGNQGRDEWLAAFNVGKTF